MSLNQHVIYCNNGGYIGECPAFRKCTFLSGSCYSGSHQVKQKRGQGGAEEQANVAQR